MVGEALAGLGALKTAFDLAKGLKEIDDAARRNAAVIELQQKILDAQQSQSAPMEQIGNLEKEIANFEKWQAESEKYELKEIYPGNFAYSFKTNVDGRSEPPHLICTTCFENRKKSIMQKSSAVHMTCPVCKTMIQFKESSYGVVRDRP